MLGVGLTYDMDQGLNWIPHYRDNAHYFERLSSLLNSDLDTGEHVLIASFLNAPQYLVDSPSFPVLAKVEVVLEEGQAPVAIVQVFGRSTRTGNAWITGFYKAENGGVAWFGILPNSASSAEQANLLVQLLFPFMEDEGARFTLVMKSVAERLSS